MSEIGLLKAAGAVAFTDGMKSVMNAQVFRRALTYAPISMRWSFIIPRTPISSATAS
jgi:dihydroorotase-like cyclic amidohydrolase